MIPPDLVNVFDERELELLIGGIADIDVDDWKKHTDYRGYTEQDEVIKYFWAVSHSLSIIYRMLILPRSFEVGMRSKNHAYYNSPLEPHGYRSTVSRIFRAAMVPDGLQSRRLVRRKLYQSRTLGKLLRLWVYIMIRLTTSSFNRLDLPEYKSYEALASKLLIAVEETVGFGQE